jgi:hypothetical protein
LVHSRFDHFRATPLGKQLEALFGTPTRYAEFAALARAGVASIVAIRDEVAEKFPEAVADVTARQFCGAMVADVMRASGHEVIQARGRVDGVFTYGAVFSPHPIARDFNAVVILLSDFPARVASAVEGFPKDSWTVRPEGTGFCVAEHVCHLRDLDEIHVDRLRAVLKQALPMLKSVDGTALAAERDYRREDVGQALASFARWRKKLCRMLRDLDPEQLKRCGLWDGSYRMSINDLARAIVDHDAEHALELEELKLEIAPRDKKK